MTGDGMNGVVGNIHVLKISNVKGGVVRETKVASGAAELDGFVNNGAKDAEGVEVQRKGEGFEGGEAEDGVGGDIVAKGEGDGDAVAIAVKVGGRVADDGNEEAMCRGVKVLWVRDGAFEFDGFEGVCTVKEVDFFDNVGAFQSDPEVEGEEAGVQEAAHVKESAEFDRVGGGS